MAIKEYRASDSHCGPAKLDFGWPDWPARKKVKYDPLVVCHMVEARHGCDVIFMSGLVEVSVLPKITCMISQCYKPVHYIICLKLFIYLAPSCREITILSSDLHQ